MKTIIRTKMSNGFTVLPNATLRDKALSFRSRGLLAFILSHSEDWEVTKVWLKSHGKEGINAISEAIRELMALGYADRQIEKCPETGRIIRHVWVFRDVPDKPKKQQKSSKTPMIVQCGKNHPMDFHAHGNLPQRRTMGQKKHSLGSSESPKERAEERPDYRASLARSAAPRAPFGDTLSCGSLRNEGRPPSDAFKRFESERPPDGGRPSAGESSFCGLIDGQL